MRGDDAEVFFVERDELEHIHGWLGPDAVGNSAICYAVSPKRATARGAGA
jgi:hypothetical protein